MKLLSTVNHFTDRSKVVQCKDRGVSRLWCIFYLRYWYLHVLHCKVVLFYVLWLCKYSTVSHHLYYQIKTIRWWIFLTNWCFNTYRSTFTLAQNFTSKAHGLLLNSIDSIEAITTLLFNGFNLIQNLFYVTVNGTSLRFALIRQIAINQGRHTDRQTVCPSSNTRSMESRADRCKIVSRPFEEHWLFIA